MKELILMMVCSFCFLAGCTQEEAATEEHPEGAKEFNFGPNPGG